MTFQLSGCSIIQQEIDWQKNNKLVVLLLWIRGLMPFGSGGFCESVAVCYGS